MGFLLRWFFCDGRPSCSFFLTFWTVLASPAFFLRREGVAETLLEGVVLFESRSRPSKSLRGESEKEKGAFYSLLQRPPASAQPLLLLQTKNPPQGPQYVVTDFSIFVCTVCSGVQ